TKNPGHEYKKVLQFLDLENDNRNSFEPINSRMVLRSKLIAHILQLPFTPAVQNLSTSLKQLFGIKYWPLIGPLLNRLRTMNLKPGTLDDIDAAFKEELKIFFS